MSQPLYESVDPETYLELAEELSSKPEAAAKRTAADRAYLAAFLKSRDLLAEKDYFTPTYSVDDHPNLTSALRRKETLGAYGNEEFRLRRARNCANYDTRDITKGTQKDACPLSWMLSTARTIIDKVKQLPPRSTQ